MSSRISAGQVKKLDLVQVSKCQADETDGRLIIGQVNRPASIQLLHPKIVGEPHPMVRSSLVAVRKRKDHPCSTNEDDEIAMAPPQ